jgi:hypothetical protein
VINDKLRALDLEVLLSVAVVVVMLDTLDVVSVKLVLVVVVGVSTWYIKEFHPLIPWQIGEVLGTMGFSVQSG